nr:unnamed protein product [Callosobruchus chinensis]
MGVGESQKTSEKTVYIYLSLKKFDSVYLGQRPLLHNNTTEVTRRIITRPFPYLNILTKLSADPNLDYFYTLGETTGFNEILHRDDLQFTYFVPADRYWNVVEEEGLIQIEKNLDILRRHLVIDHRAYSMEKLAEMSKVNYYYRSQDLPTENGILRIMVKEKDGEYYIAWRNKLIHVLKPDYVCTNGVVHVVSAAFTIFRDPHEKEKDTFQRSFLERLVTILKITFKF